LLLAWRNFNGSFSGRWGIDVAMVVGMFGFLNRETISPIVLPVYDGGSIRYGSKA
jgi:hypothetical protein